MKAPYLKLVKANGRGRQQYEVIDTVDDGPVRGSVSTNCTKKAVDSAREPHESWTFMDTADVVSDDQRAKIVNKMMARLPEETTSAQRKEIEAAANAALIRFGKKVQEDRERERPIAPEADPPGTTEGEDEGPWPQPVDGVTLLEALLAFFDRYPVFPSRAARLAVALWAMLTHLHDAVAFSPLLIITGPTRGVGKSRVLECLELVVRRAWKMVSPSDPVLYRKIDQDHPTVLIDEADTTAWRDRPGLLAMLNGGFSKAGAVVSRCGTEADDFAPRDFSVWAPKALASRGLRGCRTPPSPAPSLCTCSAACGASAWPGSASA